MHGQTRKLSLQQLQQSDVLHGPIEKSLTKIAKSRPWFDDRPEYPSVQINSSSPWAAAVQ